VAIFNTIYQQFFANQQILSPGLFVVATPIGNLADITLRALYVLQNADIIICEDTKKSMQMLNFFHITGKKTITYNDHSDQQIRDKIDQLLANNNIVALISDAGTPLISDPGYKLIKFLQQKQHKIYTVPGCSAITSALSIAGISCDKFLFVGFLPNTATAKITFLQDLPINYSIICFETAQRLPETLEIINQYLGNRFLAVAKELTKIHEQIISGSAIDVLAFFANNPDKIKGEMVLLLEKPQQQPDQTAQILSDIAKYLPTTSSKDLAIQLAGKFAVSKKIIYQLILQYNSNENS